MIARSQLMTSLLFAAGCISVVACGSDQGGSSGAATFDDASDDGALDSGLDAAADIEGDSALPDPPCDATRRPVVFAHGFLASGDTWATQAMRFASNGYCLDRIYAFDWNTLDRGADHVATLDAFILSVLETTGADQVDLAGHSAGGGLGYDYLADAERAARVAHYAHVGSFANEEPAGPEARVPTLNLWSSDDLIVDGADIPGATNVELSGVDHYAVATSPEAFTALYEHFNDGESPETTEILSTQRIDVWGKALSLGENIPAAGGTVEVYRLDGDTGFRLAPPAPIATFEIAEDGSWGPVEVAAGEYYEFRVEPAGEDAIPVHYYREPFTRTNPLVYLRTLPEPGSLAGLLLASVNFTDDAAVLVNFTSSTGIVAGVDSLTFNGIEMATDALASPESSTIAIFAYDANSNGESDEETVALFDSFPFLQGFDLFFAGDPGAIVEVDFNGRVLRAPTWPSESEGATITVFE